MSDSLLDVCDALLLEFGKRGNTIKRDDEIFDKGATKQGWNPALIQLVKDGKVTEHKFHYVLTPNGEAFATNGGYKGERERIQKREELEHLIHKSGLETNQSVLETNQSIRKLNEYTIESLIFQKWTAIISLIVATLSIALNILQFVL